MESSISGSEHRNPNSRETTAIILQDAIRVEIEL